MEPKPLNDRQSGVTKFCLAMEELRRTDVGRVKNAKDLLDHFFAHDDKKATDKMFLHFPREVRAPVVAGWGIRGQKAALRDDDERVRGVIHDALLAGDIDARSFEDGLTPSLIVDWVPLAEWWSFWRSGKVSGAPAQRALAKARELALFDDRWFLDNLEGRGGRLKGTDTICDTLSKEQIIAWIRGVHASGDGSPAGLVAALGWETILSKTAQEALLFALDALARKIGLVTTAPTVRGSLVPDIGVPDLPAEEKEPPTEQPVNLADSLPIQADSLVPGNGPTEWPEIATPGDMGYALARPSGMAAPVVKPSYGMGDDDDEITSERRAPTIKK